jgi:hypothetical protein
MVTPGGYVGKSAGARQEIIDAYIGTAAGRKQLVSGWVGTTGGNRQWYWRTEDLVITASSVLSDTSVSFSWNRIGPTEKFDYHVYRNGVGLIANKNLSFTDTGLTQSSSYNYVVYAVRNGIVADQVAISLTTKATPPPPPPTDIPFDITMVASSSRSYNENGTERTPQDPGEVYRLYTGKVSTIHGNQRATCNFPLPWYWPYINSVSEVWVKFRIGHTYASSGTTLGLAIHHNQSQASGCTGTLQWYHTKAHEGSQPDAWMGNGETSPAWKIPNGDGWLEIGNYTVPGSFNNRNWTVRQEFTAAGGAKGLALHPSDNVNNTHYGWGVGVGYTSDGYFLPQLRVVGTYRV